MNDRRGPLVGEFFTNGDIACAEGAIAAGCRFFAGYPITPATEIAERMSARMMEVGGVYIQMEDELASISAVLGASWGGVKAMTATSGPGFSLMQENIGLGIMTETPCVIVDVQRGGPSTGLPTAVSQSDIMQARWGSHGDYETIALAPSSPQELYDLTITAFNLSERYRLPVLIMTDEAVGHMTERVRMHRPTPDELFERKKPSIPPEEYLAYEAEEDDVPPMAVAGDGYRIHVTGLTHDEHGYPDMGTQAQARLVSRLIGKINNRRQEICILKERWLDDADVVVISYGISARTALLPIEWARQDGIRVGLLKLASVWPFPEQRVSELAEQVKGFVVPELNMGQIALEVERVAGGRCRTIPVTHPGGDIHDPADVLDAIRRVLA